MNFCHSAEYVLSDLKLGVRDLHIMLCSVRELRENRRSEDRMRLSRILLTRLK